MRSYLKLSKSKLKKLLNKNSKLFFRQFFQKPLSTGSLFPSSKALAEKITLYMPPGTDQESHHYLEVGGGTGAFTETMIKKMGPKDRLDIIEINPEFYKALTKKYAHLPQVDIYQLSILDWHPKFRYDVIVSGLPFNAFEASLVKSIFEHYQNILHPSGYLSYFEYLGLPAIKKLFLSYRACQEFQKTLDVTSEFNRQHQIGEEDVYGNLPPARVHHCQL